MCLKNIAVDGKLLKANGLVGADIIDVEKGINNSGTFCFICNECDSKVFQDYETPDAWTDVAPIDRVLAQQHCNQCGHLWHSGDKEVWDGMDEEILPKTKEMFDDMHKQKNMVRK